MYRRNFCIKLVLWTFLAKVAYQFLALSHIWLIVISNYSLEITYGSYFLTSPKKPACLQLWKKVHNTALNYCCYTLRLVDGDMWVPPIFIYVKVHKHARRPFLIAITGFQKQLIKQNEHFPGYLTKNVQCEIKFLS